MLVEMARMLSGLRAYLCPLPDWRDLHINLTDQEVAEQLSYGRE